MVQKQREERKVYNPKKEKVELIAGETFCHNCGIMLFEEMAYCSECGVRQERIVL